MKISTAPRLRIIANFIFKNQSEGPLVRKPDVHWIYSAGVTDMNPTNSDWPFHTLKVDLRIQLTYTSILKSTHVLYGEVHSNTSATWYST